MRRWPRSSSSSATISPPRWLLQVTELVLWRAKALMSGTRLNSTTGTPTSAHWRARCGESMAEAMTTPSIWYCRISSSTPSVSSPSLMNISTW